MTAPIFGPVLCACSWTGSLPMKTHCPACNRPPNDRVDRQRLELLRALAADPLAPRDRVRLGRLVDMGLVRATGPRPPGSDLKRQKRPLRPYALTPAGERVILAATLAERQAS